MIVFWLAASALIACALLLLLPPLLRRRRESRAVSRKATNIAVYRDQLRELEQDLAAGTLSRDNYEEAKREIERNLLEDVRDADESSKEPAAGRTAAVFLGATLPIVAFALYFAVGNFQALFPGGAGGSQQQAHNISEEQIRELAGRLSARMEKEPENVEGWIMLGRSYVALGEFDKAAKAYGSAVAREGRDAALLADYADALAMAQGKRLEGEPEKLIQRALAIDPENMKALALAGSASFERRDYTGAVAHWERLLKFAPEGSEFAQSVRASIDEARQLAKAGGAPATSAATEERAAKPAAQKSVSGVVRIAPALAARVSPDDTLFVFARAAEGPRMPLAIVRARAKDLPFNFTLDDTSAMAAGMNLSSQKSVVIGARISKSGSATPQAGDLQGLSEAVQVGKSGVVVLIDAETK
ncbi:MAG: c-type cytochrome biogenesis protein CcmI [Betaproteobacteria bacterium]